jgi:hypothetical protein
MIGGSALFKYKLRVLAHGPGPSYVATGSSAPSTPTGSGLQTFPTAVPIQAGQSIGIDLEAGAPLAYRSISGAKYDGIQPAVPDGVGGTGVPGSSPYELGYSAEILPAPTIVAVAPASGSVKGGATVAIAGSNFAEVKGVSFGSAAAKSFTVNSESLITAVAPASATLAPVIVGVTTVAGSAASTQTFAYRGCKVPKLADRKLKGAKKGIRKAGCKVGKVRKEDGVTAKTGTVVKQNPKPGKVLAPGAKVNIKLG